MKQYKIYYTGLVAIAAAMISGCSDSDEWTPGPADNETGVSAYFEQPATTSYVFDVEQPASDMVIDVTVERRNTKDSATLPLSVDNEIAGIIVPPSVTFAAGEASTSFQVNCGSMETGKRETFTIQLPADQTDIYGDGLNDVTFTVIKSRWIEISDNVRYLYSDWYYDPIYPSTTSKMYHLEYTNTFRFDDFFGSGLQMMFECTDPEGQVFVPMGNCYFDEDDGTSPWYLYDEANDDYPEWVPGGLSGYPKISTLEFFANEENSWGCMIYVGDGFEEEDLYGYFSLVSYMWQDDGNAEWCSFQVDFNLKYNPFKKD